MSSAANAYDTVLYPANVYRNTHPGRLALMARLHGLDPVPVERCRVLDIGTNVGGNLIPMAYALPDSDFTGFDLAGLPIAAGQRRIAELGLQNVRLLQADLMEAEQHQELQGEFDYIIAHGLYSWVPEPVRDALLAYCKKHLSARGVAFVSYNALPGSHIRLISREILALGERSEDDGSPADPLLEGVKLLRFVAENRPAGDAFRVLLERELASFERRGAEAVFHDEAAPCYAPLYFKDFAAHASLHGLGYLSEASLPGPLDPVYQQPVAAHLQALSHGDPVLNEHLLDLMRMRMYRETLLCHNDRERSSALRQDALEHVYFSSRATSLAGEAPGSTAYTSYDGIRIQSDHPVTVAVLSYLASIYPQSATYAELSQAALTGAEPVGAAELAQLLLQLVISHMIELDSWQPPITSEPEQRPFASLSSRRDIGTGTRVANLLHTRIELADPISRGLLTLLDGTRDRETLVRELAASLPGEDPAIFAAGVPQALAFFAKNGLLERRRG